MLLKFRSSCTGGAATAACGPMACFLGKGRGFYPRARVGRIPGSRERPAGGGGRAMTPEEFAELFGGGLGGGRGRAAGGFSDFFTNLFGEQFREEFGRGEARHRRFRHRGADVHAELHLPVSDAIAGGRSRFE